MDEELTVADSSESAKLNATHEINTNTLNGHMILYIFPISIETIEISVFFLLFYFAVEIMKMNKTRYTIVPARKTEQCRVAALFLYWKDDLTRTHMCIALLQAMPTQKQTYGYRQIANHIHSYRGRCVKMHSSAITVRCGCI